MSGVHYLDSSTLQNKCYSLQHSDRDVLPKAEFTQNDSEDDVQCLQTEQLAMWHLAETVGD